MDEINLSPTKNELDLLCYELKMLNGAFPFDESLNGSTSQNLKLEATLVHARNLIDFLQGCCQKDDIKITDFVSKKGGKMEKIALEKLSSDLKYQINKHCQHLTRTRLTRNISWPITHVAAEINAKMWIFAENLDEKYSGKLKTEIVRLCTNFLIKS